MNSSTGCNPRFSRCKTGSVEKIASWPVSRVLYGLRPKAQTWWPFLLSGHCCPPRATYPDGRAGNSPDRVSPAAPSLFGFAPGGVCHAASVAGRAVGSYPTLSPLPWRIPCGEPPGGFLSVALSLGSPPPDVIRRRVSMEPGLSSRACVSTMARAATRPAGEDVIAEHGQE